MSLQGSNSNQVNQNQVTSVKRQRAGNKIYVNRLIKETKSLIDMQDNVGQPDKGKVIANREMLSTKIQLIKSYDKQILLTLKQIWKERPVKAVSLKNL